jgi:hypothetical protein
MKVELDLSDEWVDRVVCFWARDTLDMIEELDLKHPDDVKYNKKLTSALRRVLDYMGENDESN